jgi:hypothetical protein
MCSSIVKQVSKNIGKRSRRTSFCEQKEAKKLYAFQCRAVSAPREAEQKSFLVLFFQKRTTCWPATKPHQSAAPP